jgi:hypothetical protein
MAQTRSGRAFQQWKNQQLAAAESSFPGARYYFHIVNGSVFADETGYYCSTTDEAVAHARIIAKELADDVGWIGFAVLVQDENENEIARIRITAAA